MKRFIICSLWCLTILNIGVLHAQTFSTSKTPIEERISYLQDDHNLIRTRIPETIQKEIDYVSHGVSNIVIKHYQNNVYISWNICDDLTENYFVIKKSFDNINFDTLGIINNIPCNPHYPLLYNIEDEGVSLENQNIFYTIYKIYKGESDSHHIMTLILPKKNRPLQLSTNNN